MIELLILLGIVKYREFLFTGEARAPDEIDRSLEPYAGLDHKFDEPSNVIPIRGRKWHR